MKILIIGSGGREHVLAWKINRSPIVKKIYCAPGNGGIEDVAECVNIAADDINGLLEFAKKNKIDLTVVGPESPLAQGIVDVFEKKGLKIFGPSGEAAQLESSKVFAKEFMHKYNIPTAVFASFDNIHQAQEFIRKAQFPIVIKADGLASGKGVVICQDEPSAQKALDDIMQKKVFQQAGERIVIEECLVGEEVSILAISDGKDYVVLEPAADHKRIFDDDLGPNTGGMGAYCPAPIVNDELLRIIEARIIEPTIRGMRTEGCPFKGVLYAGLMITRDGPKVLEFNVRFGDPEAEVVLTRLESDIVPLLLASIEGRMDGINLKWDKRSAVCVVLSSGGYPGAYKKGMEITGLDQVRDEGTIVFHCGTLKENNKYLTAGGRVLAVTSLDQGIEKTIARVYKQVEKIKFDRCFFRRDIGAKAFSNMRATSRGGQRG